MRSRPKGRATDALADQSSAGMASTTRAMSVGLWVLVGLAALGGLKGLLASPAHAAAPAPKPPAPTTGPQGFAELFVATYLGAGQGTEDVLQPFCGQTPELRDVRPGVLYVARTATLDARSAGERYWSVTVAADVLSTAADGYHPVGTRFYQVGVAGSPDGGFVVPDCMPTQVPAPLVARAPDLEAGTLEDPNPDDAVAEAVTRFAAAFLTGNGELVRYVAPNANLRAIQPAPFTTVRLSGLAALVLPGPDKAEQVVAQLRATDGAGRVTFLQYALELAQRSGRWEVRSLLPAPPLSRPPAAAPTTIGGGDLTGVTTTAPQLAPSSTSSTSSTTTTTVPTTTTRPNPGARTTP